MASKINAFLACFMIIMCLVFAYFMAFTDLMAEDLKGVKRTIFIVVMLAYAGYRVFRLIKSVNEQSQNPE